MYIKNVLLTIKIHCFLLFCVLDYMYNTLLGRAVGLPPLPTEDVVFLMQMVYVK